MNTPQKSNKPQKSDPKTMLTALKLTTTIGAVSLTLAGWGLLSRAESVAAAQAAQTTTTELAASSLTATSNSLTGATTASISSESMEAAARRATATATAVATATATENSVALPTATPLPKATATTAPTVTPEATDTPVAKFKLNVVQWVSNQNGDPIAVVQDNSGVLWYVWGDDVPKIEQGLDPQYQPVPVNSVGRSRGS